MNNTIVKNKVTSHTFKILIAFLFTILIALSSKISVPFYPVPMTMQTFVVLFTGFTLATGVSAPVRPTWISIFKISVMELLAENL